MKCGAYKPTTRVSCDLDVGHSGQHYAEGYNTWANPEWAGPADMFDDTTEGNSRFCLVIEFDQEEDILGADVMYAQLAASLAVDNFRKSMKVSRVELIDRAHTVDENPSLTLCEG